MQLKTLLKLIFIPLLLTFLSACGGDIGERSSSLSLTTSSASLHTTSGHVFAIITTRVNNDKGNPLFGARVQFDTNLGRLEKTSERTDSDGIIKLKFYPGQESGTATITAFVNGLQRAVSINIIAPAGTISARVNSLDLRSANPEIVADGTSVVKLISRVLGDNNQPLAGKTVTFNTNQGTLLSDLAGTNSGTSLIATTDINGHAVVFLRSGTRASVALISVNIAGVNASISVEFVPGSIDSTNSSITFTPSTIPADGVSTTEVEVLLLDANNNFVADATAAVTLQTTDGIVTTTNPAAISLGKARFTLQSSNNAGTVNVSIFEDANVTGQLTFGAPSTGEPFQITVTPEDNRLYVKGVGKKDSISIVIAIRDSAGNLIANADAGVNNLRVALISRPHGGETLTGLNAASQVISSPDEILVRTVDGSSSITLKSGLLPGVIGLRIEALSNAGQSLSPTVSANISEISISSGPPHNIAVSYPSMDSVENLGGGIYRRIGSLSVTDQYGNSVPDGTVINLGFLDSIIVSNTTPAINAVADDNASITLDNNRLSDGTNTGLDSADITRNNASRQILPNDRVLVLNAQANDKARFVTSVGNSFIDTNKPYKHTQGGLSYLVGSALLGGQVFGFNHQISDYSTGFATTRNGITTFRITYPADSSRILAGCYSDPTIDTRFLPLGSAQTWLIAESNETGAATLDSRGCFAAIHPFTLTNLSGVESIASTTTINFLLEDTGLINLPFVTLNASIAVETNTGTMLNITVSNCNGSANRRTSINGTCSLTITVVSGADSGDAATVIISAPGQASSTVSVAIP